MVKTVQSDAAYETDFADDLAKAYLNLAQTTAVTTSRDDPQPVDSGQKDQTDVQNKAADPDEKKAQESRSSKYNIGVKDGGNVTKPSKWSDVPDDEWGDPVNYKLPMPDESHTRNAASRVAQDDFRKAYTDKELSVIEGRVNKRKKALGIGEDDDEKKSFTPEEQKSFDDDIDVWTFDTVVDNSGSEGTSKDSDPMPTVKDMARISEAGSVEARKGDFIVLVKSEDNDTFTIQTHPDAVFDGAYVIGQVADTVTMNATEYALFGVKETVDKDGIQFRRTIFEPVKIEDSEEPIQPVQLSTSDTDLEKGTCTLSWTEGIITFALPTSDGGTKNASDTETATKDADPAPTATEDSTNKGDTPPVKKGLSVAEQLWDTPVSWEFEDIFYAFLSCCYKLGIAAEVNDQEPTPEQYIDLINQMAQLMMQVVGSDADGDLADDMFLSFKKRFTNRDILIKQVRLMPLTSKAGSRHNSEDRERFKEMHSLLTELDSSVCPAQEDKSAEIDDLTAKVADLTLQKNTFETDIATKRQELEELQTKSEEATRLDGEIATKSEELKKVSDELEEKTAALEAHNNAPRPTKSNREVVVVDTLLTQAHKMPSFIEMTNNDLSLDDAANKLYGV